jgi:putative ATPase
MNKPLATILRPDNFNDFFGQERLVSKNSWLRSSIKKDQLPSLIFWGPPGSGKTTLALIMAKETKAVFKSLSATSSGLKELRDIVEEAKANLRLGEKTILFIDEIHRWNKAQQDALLPEVENGILILIGASTENPSFSINSALLSRLKVVVLEKVKEKELLKILSRGLKYLKIEAEKDVLELIASLSGGDARRSLNILEMAYRSGKKINIELIKDLANKPQLDYDRKGDGHYGMISALHKSMRGGDGKASLYWLARMISAGEDPLFIARRLIRFASEDIGLANNSALALAVATHQACEKIGLPECDLSLAQCVVYLAKSKKSILVYESYNKAVDEVYESGSLLVPPHLVNPVSKLMKDLGYGNDYKYTPKEDSSEQSYLPKGLLNKKFKDLKI